MKIIKFHNLYVPLNQSHNVYRHFGIKLDKLIFLELHELLYIIHSDMKKDYPVYIKPYFFLKSNYNVLRPVNYNLEYILKYNEYLYKDMYKKCRRWLDKYMEDIINWEDIDISYENNLDKKERNVFRTIFYKLQKNENMFKTRNNYNINVNLEDKASTSRRDDTSQLNTNCVNIEKPTLQLFNISEDFNKFEIPNINICNSTKYLKSAIVESNDLNLLDYLYFDLYKTTSNFNRVRDRPITQVMYINKYIRISQIRDLIRNKIVCVISMEEYVILDVREMKRLSFDLDDKLIKKKSKERESDLFIVDN